ncbi:cell division protein FtsX [Hyphomicrobium sulfonivorans]|uniref:cell division protein FtsX n=1 Tax=Hyphomicrobium sulfonivorans TaxID=121290 RepID=UPI00156DE95B|nr:ABC transporter permease [Hyphomicrobium sulfonivorans]MBI1649439.1 ABC transporter permease [Hyphomicrobium sulfonivorans]NSL71356.1 ABC transporter permease [Hyphomicrobium sulfonivorans]
MSGSYDRPSGRGDRSGSHAAADYDPYDSTMTGSPDGYGQQGYGAQPEPTRTEPPRRRIPSTRGRKPKHESASTPVVPPDSVTGRSLTLVIAIMCFLACLTAGAVYMINQSANAWLQDIASEVTVQVEPRDGIDMEKTLRDAENFLRAQPGIARADALSLESSTKMLEPWLGKSDVLSELPVPRMIAVEIDRSAAPDTDALRAELTRKFPSATLDDHRRWQQQIRTVMRSFALGGLFILLLVAAATTAIIISATRSALASNREIVEVLHLVGATDRYIAREFERHFLRLGIRAGIVGAASAMGVFFGMPYMMRVLGGGGMTNAEVHRLIGSGGLDATGYVLLGIVVIIISALCMLTSRFGVFRILNAKL